MHHDAKLHRYNAGLRRSMGSKLFWLNEVPLESLATVVDFGCADGSMLKAIDGTLPEDCIKIGVDSNPAMLRAAESNYWEGDMWTGYLSDAHPHLADLPPGRTSCLILSSVLHEIEGDVEDFWQEVERMKFDYIVVRDMAVSEVAFRRTLSTEWLKARAGLSAEEWAIMQDVKDRHHPEELHLVPSVASHIHGLLKIVHKQDYATEAHEHYLRKTSEEYYRMFTAGPYVPLSFASTVTPFFKRFCYESGFDFKDCPPFPITTHIECVLAHQRHL